jgi:hypothetical protein
MVVVGIINLSEKSNIMEWISIEDRLPEIPEGQYGVSVIVAQFDPVYEEICPGKGCSVQEMVYSKITEKDRERWHYPQELKADFMEWYHGTENFKGPPGDRVTHWMPLPEPPTKKKGKC